MAPVTGLYMLFGPDIWIGQMYVAVVGAVTVLVATRLAKESMGVHWAVLVGVVLALFPSQAFWSSQLMKDASVWLVLVALALVIAVGNRVTGKRLVLSGVGVAVLLSALAFLREHTLVVAAWATMIAALFGIARERVPRIAGALLLSITIPWAVAAIGPAGIGLISNAGSLETIRFQMAQGANTAIVDTIPGGTEAALEQVISEQEEVTRQINELQSDGPAEQPEDADRLNSLLERQAALLAEQDRLTTPPPGVTLSDDSALAPDIRHLPRGISVMLIEPLPLPFDGSPSLKLARLESLIWFPLLIAGGYGLWVSRRHLRAFAFPISCAGGVLLMYALTEGNVGTAHRHRGEIVWIVALLASLGLSHFMDRRRKSQ